MVLHIMGGGAHDPAVMGGTQGGVQGGTWWKEPYKGHPR